MLFSNMPARIVEALGAIGDRGLIQQFYNDLMSRDNGAALAKTVLGPTPGKDMSVSTAESHIRQLYRECLNDDGFSKKVFVSSTLVKQLEKAVEGGSHRYSDSTRRKAASHPLFEPDLSLDEDGGEKKKKTDVFNFQKQHKMKTRFASRNDSGSASAESTPISVQHSLRRKAPTTQAAPAASPRATQSSTADFDVKNDSRKRFSTTNDASDDTRRIVSFADDDESASSSASSASDVSQDLTPRAPVMHALDFALRRADPIPRQLVDDALSHLDKHRLLSFCTEKPTLRDDVRLVVDHLQSVIDVPSLQHMVRGATAAQEATLSQQHHDWLVLAALLRLVWTASATNHDDFVTLFDIVTRFVAYRARSLAFDRFKLTFDSSEQRFVGLPAHHMLNDERVAAARQSVLAAAHSLAGRRNFNYNNDKNTKAGAGGRRLSQRKHLDISVTDTNRLPVGDESEHSDADCVASTEDYSSDSSHRR